MSRILFVSGAIGLGHVTRDLAIARAMRDQAPGVDIRWLAAPPATDVLREAGETLVAQCARWLGTTHVAEASVLGGRANLVRYAYRCLPIWFRNSTIVAALARTGDYDLVVGDEAFDIDIPLIARTLRLPVPYVMIFDFVGVDTMWHGPVHTVAAWMLNALWSFDCGIYNGSPHSAIFIGEPDDVPAAPFAPGLRDRRAHAEQHYEFVGHALNFDPAEHADQAAARSRLGYAPGPLVMCAVGGTACGEELVERCTSAFEPLRKLLPGVRMVIVAGPRLAASAQVPEGVSVLGYVPRLWEHFAAADVVVTQCGGTSTAEVAAMRRPFIYFPIEGHFEQERIASRLEARGVGTRMSLSHTSADELAQAIACHHGGQPGPPPMPLDGAKNAARHILGRLGPQGA